jgi:asparagine synthase (glutamine-hydrolysing)
VETFYEGVRRVPGATTAVFATNGLRLNRYWTPEPKRQLRLGSDQDYVELARELLDRAVACRLRAKNGLASTLSGGLDSSAVAATASRLLAPNRLLTITSVPPEGMELPSHSAKYKDERPYVSAIAAMYPNMNSVLASSLEPHWIETDPTAFFEAGGRPARSVTNIGWLLPGYQCLSEAGISALLTGEGGNAAWSYDGLRRLNEMFRNGNWLHLAHELYLAGRRRPYGMGWKALLRREILRSLEPVMLTKWRRRLKTGEAELWSGISGIRPDFTRDIDLSGRCSKAGYNMHLQFNSEDGLGMRLEMLKWVEHSSDIFTALRALTGVETRSPLLDIRLLEFCLSLPEEQFLKDGNFRRLPRVVMDGRLPQPVLENNLIGSQNPEIMRRVKAVRSGMLAEIEELKQVPLAARAIDLPRLSQIVRDWPDGRQVTLLLPRALHVGRFLRWAEAGKL